MKPHKPYKQRKYDKDIMDRKKSYTMYLNRFFGAEETRFILEKAFGKTILTKYDKRFLRHGYGSWLRNIKPHLYNEYFKNWDWESMNKFKQESQKREVA